MKKYTLFFLALLCSFSSLFAQEDGGGEEEQSAAPVAETFYGTRATNLHTVKQIGHRVLAYRISHRLGDIKSGGYNFFGLDGPASISLMFDYGITDDLMIGIARDQFNKVYNGYAKYALLKQTPGKMPVSVSVYGKANIISLRDEAAAANGFDRFGNFSHRMSYVSQILVARKFGERFSLQVAPTYVHHNLVERSGDANGMFALSTVGQFKINKRLGISAEFNYVLNDYVTNTNLFHPSAAVGLDVVTGGHIFQIMVGNSMPINEAFAIPYTRNSLSDGWRIGFNISRNFWL